jgi:hypothetical protein
VLSTVTVGILAAQRAHAEPDDLRALTAVIDKSAQRAESAFGADLAARRSANPITLCDGCGIDFVTVTGRILIT